MSKNQKNIYQMRSRIAEINARITEVADLIEKEKRAMTKEESDEMGALQSEKQILSLRIERMSGNNEVNEKEQRRELLFARAITAFVQNRAMPEECAGMIDGNTIEIPRYRDVQDSTTVTPLIPLTIGDIVEPLEKGLILDKVGVKMQSGIVGDWVLPVVAGIEATIEDENAEVADTKIDITQLKPAPKRVALAIPVSNRAIDQTNGALLEIVNKQIVMGLTRLLNKWMFNPTQLSKASDGCFVKAIAAPAVTTTAGESLTWKDITKLKAAVLKSGVIVDGTAAFVCSATTYADLEATPKDAGSGRMILENGMISGIPVFVTEYIGENVLGFGVFNYELVGQFGKMHLLIDPYTGAKKNLVYFVLNTDFDMLTIRTEAFAAAKITPGD